MTTITDEKDGELLWTDTHIRTKQFISMDCGRVSFCLRGDPDYFSITTRPRLPHSSQSFTINCGRFAAILDENVGIYQFFHNSNKQDLKHATSIIWTLHTYVHVFHQQMNIQPILIGTTN